MDRADRAGKASRLSKGASEFEHLPTPYLSRGFFGSTKKSPAPRWGEPWRQPIDLTIPSPLVEVHILPEGFPKLVPCWSTTREQLFRGRDFEKEKTSSWRILQIGKPNISTKGLE